MAESPSLHDPIEDLRLAQNPTTPPEILAAIAQHLVMTADHDYDRPSSGREFLRTKANQGPLSAVFNRKPPSAITSALVGNPNTPQRYLLHFAADVPEAFLENPVLLLLLLEHPALFQEMTLIRLLVFLANASIPTELLGTIGASADVAVADTIRLHVNMHEPLLASWRADVQTELARLPLPSVDSQQALIEHLALDTIPPWLYQQLVDSPLEHIQAVLHTPSEVVAHDQPPSLSFAINQQIFESQTIRDAPQAQRRLAAESSDLAILRMLSTDPDMGVRARVAANPHTPIETLHELEYDDMQPVRAALAANPGIPLDILERLAGDYSWSAVPIRLAVVRHPHVTPELLEQLASDESVFVRKEVLNHPALPATAYHQIQERGLTLALYSIEPFFHFIAAAHPATNPAYLAQCVRSPYWQARYAVATNPATPLPTVQSLADDGNVYVRMAARQYLEHLASKDFA